LSDASVPVIRVATRQSPLAIWQAEHVARLLARSGVESELVPLVSGGDTDMRPIDSARQIGVFTKRIQQAVIDEEADVAVHSLKDLPTEADNQLVLAAVPERETVADSLVSAQSWTLADLPERAIVGTGSRRRAAQLLNRRSDLRVEPIRGNVQTRLAKLDAGEFDAIMLAEAGLQRLEMNELPRSQFSILEMLPAPGQGALGIEVRSADDATFEYVSKLDHRGTRAAVTAERTLLAALHGGCLAPIAAYASVEADLLSLSAVVLSSDGSVRLDQQASVKLEHDDWNEIAFQLAMRVADDLLSRGARELVEAAR
jgi:hydroxymethylbilane synthase